MRRGQGQCPSDHRTPAGHPPSWSEAAGVSAEGPALDTRGRSDGPQPCSPATWTLPPVCVTKDVRLKRSIWMCSTLCNTRTEGENFNSSERIASRRRTDGNNAAFGWGNPHTVNVFWLTCCCPGTDRRNSPEACRSPYQEWRTSSTALGKWQHVKINNINIIQSDYKNQVLVVGSSYIWKCT